MVRPRAITAITRASPLRISMRRVKMGTIFTISVSAIAQAPTKIPLNIPKIPTPTGQKIYLAVCV